MIKLLENNEILAGMLDIIPVGISITDSEGKIIRCNKASEQILGLTQEDHLSRTISGTEWKIIREDGTPLSPNEYTSAKALYEKTA